MKLFCFFIGYVVIMFLAQTPVNGGKPRPPPVPPRPNKQIIDEAMARSKKKIIAPSGLFKNQLNGQSRGDLGRHVHENGQKRPTVLLITNGKTICKDDRVAQSKPGSESPRIARNDDRVGFQSRPNGDESPRIKHSNWYQVDENSGKPIQYSSCRIILDGDTSSSDSSPVQQRLNMSVLQGLPPLPKSLSGVNLLESVKVTTPPAPVPESPPQTPSTQAERRNPPPPPRKMTSLDTKLAILRKEMVSGFMFLT